MALKLNRSLWVAAVTAAIFLAGCGTWWQQQQAWQRRQSYERCQKRRVAIEQQLSQIDRAQDSLRKIEAERYQASPAPKPIDPELASRFSQLDRQIDEERYLAALSTWKQQEQQRLAQWQKQQQQRRDEAQLQRTAAISKLTTIDTSLMKNGTPDAAQLDRLRTCAKP